MAHPPCAGISILARKTKTSSKYKLSILEFKIALEVLVIA